MTNSLAVYEGGDIDGIIHDIEKMKDMSKKLMQTKHYQKMGEDGIFAIGMMAKSIGMPVMEALNGELYYVQGRVGMSAESMNKKIRQAGHSITVKQLNDKGCVLLGKRCDTGDTAEISFMREDATRTGKLGTYEKNLLDMFFARALSRLKRILFPDICTKVYEKTECEDIAVDEKKTIDVTPVNAEPAAIEQKSPFKLDLEEKNADIVQFCLDHSMEDDLDQVKGFIVRYGMHYEKLVGECLNEFNTDIEKFKKTFDTWKNKKS